MTRENLVWVAIRIAGLFLLLRLIVLVPDLIQAVIWLIYIGTDSASSLGSELAAKTAWSQVGGELAAMVLYLVGGLYLLRRGKWVFNLVRFPQTKGSE